MRPRARARALMRTHTSTRAHSHTHPERINEDENERYPGHEFPVLHTGKLQILTAPRTTGSIGIGRQIAITADLSAYESLHDSKRRPGVDQEVQEHEVVPKDINSLLIPVHLVLFSIFCALPLGVSILLSLSISSSHHRADPDVKDGKNKQHVHHQR